MTTESKIREALERLAELRRLFGGLEELHQAVEAGTFAAERVEQAEAQAWIAKAEAAEQRYRQAQQATAILEAKAEDARATLRNMVDSGLRIRRSKGFL